MSWLSGFLFNPWMALGTGAVASPILIHILSRRRYRRIRWAAMDFLLDANRRNRRRVRLEQLILLALRCLVVLLLALAFARPFLSSGMFASLVGGSQTEHIVVLDDSFSMAAVSRDATAPSARLSCFDNGKAAVESIAKLVSASTTSDALSLYVASRPEEPVLSIPNLSDSNRVRLREALSGLNATQHGSVIADAIQGVARQLTVAPSRANAVVYVVSDFQRIDWRSQPSEAGSDVLAGPLARLEALNADEVRVRCVLVNAARNVHDNLAIQDIRADRPQTVAGVPSRFVVSVANHSDEPQRDIELGVAIEGRRLPPIVIREIMPGEVVQEPIEITFDQDGANFVEVELLGAASSADCLALDNRRGTSVDVGAAIRVRIVDGEPSSDQYRDETFLLRTALRPAGRATSGIEITTIEESELDDADFSEDHVVILANVGRVSRSASEKLQAFVESGGGLLVFAGDLVDVAEYNELLYRAGSGLLPLPLSGPAEAPPGADAIAIDAWDPANPMLRAFEGPTAELLRQVRIDAYLRVDEPDAASEPGLESPGNEGLDSANRVPVIVARMNDAYRSPLIVEKQTGRGRTVFVATTADQEWNDWASNFSYLPFVLETVQYIARPSNHPKDQVVGEPLRCDVDVTSVEPVVALRTPEFPTDPEIMLKVNGVEPAVNATGAASGESVENGRNSPFVSFGDTDRVGRYQFVMKRTRGGSLIQFATVNPDATESNLAAIARDELMTGTEKMATQYVADPSELVAVADNGRSEFWWPILLAVAVLLMAEQALAWRFGSRT